MVFRRFQKLHQDQSISHKKSPPNPHRLKKKKKKPVTLARLTQWVLNSRQMLQVPPGQENIGFSVRLPKEAYPSDTVSIELPSDAASASWSGKHWLFGPSTKRGLPV